MKEVTFVDITLWSRLAEIAQQYLAKGRSVFIEGRLQQESWEDRSGQKRNRLKVVAENLQLLGGREERKPASAPKPEAQSPSTRQPAPPPRQQPTDEPNDIPF